MNSTTTNEFEIAGVEHPSHRLVNGTPLTTSFSAGNIVAADASGEASPTRSGIIKGKSMAADEDAGAVASACTTDGRAGDVKRLRNAGAKKVRFHIGDDSRIDDARDGKVDDCSTGTDTSSFGRPLRTNSPSLWRSKKTARSLSNSEPDAGKTTTTPTSLGQEQPAQPLFKTPARGGKRGAGKARSLSWEDIAARNLRTDVGEGEEAIVSQRPNMMARCQARHPTKRRHVGRRDLCCGSQ